MDEIPNNSSISAIVEKQFDIKSTMDVNPLITSLPTALTKIVNSNQQRLGLTIMNLGDTSMYIAPDNLVSTTRGLLLVANGGMVSFRWDVDFILCAYEWYGLSVTSANNIFCVEVKSL